MFLWTYYFSNWFHIIFTLNYIFLTFSCSLLPFRTAKCLQAVENGRYWSTLHGVSTVCGIWPSDCSPSDHEHVFTWSDGDPQSCEALGEEHECSVCIHRHRLRVAHHRDSDTLQEQGELYRNACFQYRNDCKIKVYMWDLMLHSWKKSYNYEL